MHSTERPSAFGSGTARTHAPQDDGRHGDVRAHLDAPRRQPRQAP